MHTAWRWARFQTILVSGGSWAVVSGDFADIVGNSPTIRAVLGQVEMVAPSHSTLLLLGETGTGKDLRARAIHERRQRRLVATMTDGIEIDIPAAC